MIYDATIPILVTLYFDAIRELHSQIWLVTRYFFICLGQRYLPSKVMATS
jgi:hypothetical protein